MIHINMSGYVRPTAPADETGDQPMPADPMPTDDDPGFDLPASEAYAMIVRAFVNLGMSRSDAERYAFAAELEAGPIFRAAGRKQAAAEAEAAILAAPIGPYVRIERAIEIVRTALDVPDAG